MLNLATGPCRYAAVVLSLAGTVAATKAGPAYGQANASPPTLAVELNRLDTSDRACRITFVARNGLPEDLANWGYEMVLFDKDGGVDRLSKFSFGAVPAGKTVVKRFNLPELDCGHLSRILINSAFACEGVGAEQNCVDALAITNRTDVTFGL